MIRRGEIRVHKDSGLRVRVITVHPDGWVDVEFPDYRCRRTSWRAPKSGYQAADLYEFFDRDPRATSEAQGGPR